MIAESRLSKLSAASLKGVSVLGRASQSTVGRCNATLLKVREFSRTFEGTLTHAPFLSVCLRTNPQDTCHLKPQWHRRPPPPPHPTPTGPDPTRRSLRRVCNRQGEKDYIWLMCFSLTQRQSSSCLTSQTFPSL